MEDWIELTIEGRQQRLPSGAAFAQAAATTRPEGGLPVLGAVACGRLYSLHETIPGSGEVSFFDITHAEGARIYARSASFLLVMAVQELFDGAKVLIDYSINHCLYCEVKWQRRLTAVDLKEIEGRMREIVTRNEPFKPMRMGAAEAKAALMADGRADAADLLPDSGEFEGFRCGGMIDTYYGPLVPSTGYLKLFRLQYYLPGFLLMLPNSCEPDSVPDFRDMPKLLAVYNESAEFDRQIGISRISELNGAIREGHAREAVRVCEARQDGRIARITDVICRERRQVILVAGPSSSGKTTFANRLMVHLHTFGQNPLLLSLDDYYLNRDECPRCADGTFDLESIDALDVPLFEEQLTALLSGEQVDLARFDFKTGRSGRVGRLTSVGHGHPLIIEGINGLNDRLSRSIPANIKFRIFISALTQLNIDDHNRIPTTDLRLIRRIVRDSLSRGRSAEKTIEDWPAVHNAEFKNIFPHQENADVIFNSAMAYELAALRTVALPMLEAIPACHPSRIEADRLISMLALVDPLPCPDEIPPTSILREFIGGCTFYQ